MAELNVDSIALEGFGVQVSQLGRHVTITLRGSADMEAIDPFRKALQQLQRELVRLNLNSVEFDFRQLYFINSSCIKVLLQFVTSKRGEDSHCPVQFTIDPNLSWQMRAFSPVQRFAPQAVSIVQL